MPGLFRSLLICLLALALPAQGVVAATMVFCHGHPHAAADVSTPHHGTDAVSMAHSGSHGHDPSAALHDHATQGEAAMDTESVASTADGNASRAVPSDPHKCSACAVCCAATATSSTVIVVPAAVVAPTLFSAVVATVEPFAVGGPDRPPRSPIVLPA